MRADTEANQAAGDLRGLEGEEMITIEECTRKKTCYDCDNIRCGFQGQKEADCPKYRCDRPDILAYDCEHCAFIDNFIEDMRKEYGKKVTE